MVGTHVGMAIGKDGVTQMGLEDVSIMRALPNMKILNPASYSEAIKVIEYLCETDLQSPHYLRLGRQPVEDIEIPFEFGKGQVVKWGAYDEGPDITIFSTLLPIKGEDDSKSTPTSNILPSINSWTSTADDCLTKCSISA